MVAPPDRDDHLLEAPLDLDQFVQALSTAFSTLDDAVFVIGSSPRTIVACNEAAERMFGYTVEEMVGRDTRMLHVDEESFREFARRGDVELLSTGLFKCSYRMRRRDGTEFASLHTVSLLQRERGLSGGAVSIVRDASELDELARALRESQERFLHGQKLQVVGRIAATISHDSNNLLMTIYGNAGSLLDSPLDPQQRAWTEQILSAVDRAASLTRRIVSFVRIEPSGDGPIDLNATIRGFGDLLGRVLGESIDLVLHLEPGVGAVALGSVDVEQILLNLAVNARDAISGRGRFVVETESATLDESRASELDVPPGVYAILSMSDDGRGMDERTLEHIFEPFFTTREETGTGLGLAAVREIVARGKGSVRAYSEPGLGTTFRLVLPTCDALASTPLRAGATTRAGAGTILVVEDDDGVRSVISRLLERHGYRVLAASTGDEAMEVLARHGAWVRLVVSDLSLPFPGGGDVPERLRAESPDLPILLTSGHPSGNERAAALPRSAFLAKPFSEDALLEAVRELLHEPGETQRDPSLTPPDSAR